MSAQHIQGNRVTTPPVLWLEAMDVILQRLNRGLESRMKDIYCLSASAQQHGSVYWDREAMVKVNTQISASNKHQSLKKLLGSCFSIQESPIWADSSTESQCHELEQLAGGAQQLASLTGSRAFHRFTAAQIMRVAHDHHEEFEDTCHISIVSSFITTLMLGTLTPVACWVTFALLRAVSVGFNFS